MFVWWWLIVADGMVNGIVSAIPTVDDDCSKGDLAVGSVTGWFC